MPQYTYSDITQFRLAPIYRMWLMVDPAPAGWTIEDAPSTTVTTTVLQLTHTEIESNVQVTPITRRTMHGGDRQVGQQLQATIYTSVASYAELHNLLSNFVGRRVSAKIQFGGHRSAPSIPGMTGQAELPGYQQLFLYLTKLDAWDARVEVNYRVEPAEFRLRTIITITAPLPAGTGLGSLLTDNDTSYWI